MPISRLPDTARTCADLIDRLGGINPSRILLRPPPGTATEADLIHINDRKESICELVDGTLVEKGMGLIKSILVVALSCPLHEHVRRQNLGIVTGSRGPMRLGPGLVRGPDIAFSPWSRIPGGRISDEPIADFSADVIVEIPTPANTGGEMARKRREFFGAGARLIWVVDLVARTVAVFEGPERSTLLDASRTLDGGEVLPGLSLPLAELFGELDWRAD